MMSVSEERQIVERIKEYIKKERPVTDSYIMLRDGRILNIDNYRDVVKAGRLNPQDAYVYINIDKTLSGSYFHYPFLFWISISLNAYLSRLGFYYDNVVPATGLQYVTVSESYEKYFTIELANLDTIVNNTNLRKIVSDILGGKLISGEKELVGKEYNTIFGILHSRKLFVGHSAGEVKTIIHYYYDNNDKSLAKDVSRIAIDYERIFQPYRVCYETRTWKEVDCWKIELD